MKKMITIIWVVLLSSSVNSFAQEGLSLKGAIDLAIQQNNTLRADSLGILQTQFRNKELAGSFLPQVSLANRAEYNAAIPSQLMPGTLAGQPSKDLVPVKFGTRYMMSTGLEVNQAIFRKDLSVKLKASDLYTNMAITRYQLSREELVYAVSASFYGLQASYELVQSARFDYENIREVLNIAKAQYEAGTLKKIDYQTLQINLANKGALVDQLETSYKEQLAYFNYLLGVSAEKETVIFGDYSKVGSLALPPDAVAGRVDIRLQNQQIQPRIVDLKSIEAEKLPTVNGYFRNTIQSSFNQASYAFDADYRFKASTIGVSLNLSLFDGNRRKSRLKATEIELNQLKLQGTQLQEQASMELLRASRTFISNKHQMEITKSNLDLAEKVFISRKALYAEGVATLIELLDAERELSQARTNYTQALINVQKGWLDVHKSNGTLLTEFIRSI